MKNDHFSYTFPNYITWKLDLSGLESLDKLFSSKKIKRIRLAEKRLSEAGYFFDFKPVTEKLLNEFEVVYKKHLSKKTHANPSNIVERVLKKTQKKNRQYEMLALSDGATIVGGLVYRLGSGKLSAAFKAFPDLPGITLPIGLTYLAERLFFARAIEQNRPFIIHGKDSNGYGYYHLSIGLAMFKLSIGCEPYVSIDENITFFKLNDIKPPQNESLFFCGSQKGEKIKKAVLFTPLEESAARAQYPALFERLEVEVAGI